MSLYLFKEIHQLQTKLDKLTNEFNQYKAQSSKELQITREHFLHSRSGIPLKDWNIKDGSGYIDLTPQQAYEIYQNPNSIYTVVDVSEVQSPENFRFDNLIHCPLDQIESRIDELKSLTGVLLIISENGVRSIIACHKLVKNGLYHSLNISGGYEFWPESSNGKSENLEKHQDDKDKQAA